MESTAGENTEEREDLTPWQPRGYQLEMAAASLRENIIVTMDTGSGKTFIAKLRIEAELLRSPEKLVWFTTPSVILAEQQYAYLSYGLPRWQARLITGSDKIELWSTQDIWDGVLLNINIVVSTPQILLEGLTHGFIKLSRISLLVFDEAHHCVGRAPVNKIMQDFYHPLRQSQVSTAHPHVLGLTASPITKANIRGMETLERNLSSLCKAPTRHLEEYRRFSHQPQFVVLEYHLYSTPTSPPIETMLKILDEVDIKDDPYMKQLLRNGGPRALQKYLKAEHKRSTYSMDQLKKLCGNTEHLFEQLGAWPTHAYLHEIFTKLQDILVTKSNLLATLSLEEHYYLSNVLSHVRDAVAIAVRQDEEMDQLSAKVKRLIEFMEQEYEPGISCIIFVQRRSTAWALCHLLKSHLSLHKYSVFSLVGTSRGGGKESLIDLADMGIQKTGLERFRAGRDQICVATPVMEEGVDIQATNLVIRFDDPANVRSFIQSRGRARCVESKFVILRNLDGPDSEYTLWETLEAEMKARYMDEMREISNRVQLEDVEEDSDQRYLVPATGAMLTFENATGHLEHFCQTLEKQSLEPNPRPEFIYEGYGDNLSAKVVLPSSLHPDLRLFRGKGKWRTERAARKDAAFEAYKTLHGAGLVNDHLLPPPRASIAKKFAVRIASETRASFCNIHARLNPWKSITNDLSKAGNLYAHSIQVVSAEEELPGLLLFLPANLLSLFDVPLYFSHTQTLTAKIVPVNWQLPRDLPLQLFQEMTAFLLKTALRSRHQVPASGHPFLLLPADHLGSLNEWYRSIRQQSSLIKTISECSSQGGVRLVRHPSTQIPCLLNLDAVQHTTLTNDFFADEPAVLIQRLPRRLDYLNRNTAPLSMKARPHAIPIDGSIVEGLPAAYSQVVKFIPSVLQILGLALSAQACFEQVLHPLGISDMRLITEALTAPQAYAQFNYERLEFLGDTLLKFYATLQIFSDPKNLHKPEGHLTIETEKLINNARLHRAAIDLGLDVFMNLEGFVPKKWLPQSVCVEVTGAQNFRRKVSTKTTADVVEALIGVAHLDAVPGEEKDIKPVRLLNRLIPEIEWRLPKENVDSLSGFQNVDGINMEPLTEVEEMIGYHFNQNSLLIEALNHSSIDTRVPTYGRLEFLGDAILDRLVNAAVYDSPTRYAQDQLHLRQISSVNASYLGFLCLDARHDVKVMEVKSSGNQKTVLLEPVTQKKYLWQYMSHSSLEIPQLQQRSFARYLECQAQIKEELSTGRTYPWALLASLDAPKFFSDLIESILGAVFIDSGASLKACSVVLDKLGLAKFLRRLVEDPDIILKPPKSLLLEALGQIHRYTQMPKLAIIGSPGVEADRYGCKVGINGEGLAEVNDALSKDEAMHRACDAALQRLVEKEGRYELRKRAREEEEKEIEKEEEKAVEVDVNSGTEEDGEVSA